MKFIIIVVVVFGLVFGYSFVQEAKATPFDQYQLQEKPEIKIEDLLKTIGIILGVIAGTFVLVKIAQSKVLLVALICLAVFGFLFYYAGYSGINQDGTPAKQVVRVVQPVGDPGVDREYSEINRTNSVTNVISASSVVIYILIGVVVLFVVSFIALIIKGAAV